MALNESFLNQEALNEEAAETQPELESLSGRLCITSAIASLPDPISYLSIISQVHQYDHFGKICITGFTHRRNYDGRICITGEAHQRTISGRLCIVSIVREIPGPVGPHGVSASTPTGVLPQTGSAIFTRWQEVSAKEMLVHRHWDFHEGARLNFDDSRKAWRLEMNVTGEKQAEVAQFFIDHVWAGKSFYFYDLQANGFQYDGTGVLTTGRYKVRFVDEDFPRVQVSSASAESAGGRFTIPFSIIEVD